MADLEEENAMNGHFYKPQTPLGGCCVPLSEFCLDCSPGPLKTGTFREETCETLHCLNESNPLEHMTIALTLREKN